MREVPRVFTFSSGIPDYLIFYERVDNFYDLLFAVHGHIVRNAVKLPKHRLVFPRVRRGSILHQVKRVIGFNVLLLRLNRALSEGRHSYGQRVFVNEMTVYPSNFFIDLVKDSFNPLIEAVDVAPNDQRACRAESFLPRQVCPFGRDRLMVRRRNPCSRLVLYLIHIYVAMHGILNAVLPRPNVNPATLGNGRGRQPHSVLSYCPRPLRHACAKHQGLLQDLSCHASSVVEDGQLMDLPTRSLDDRFSPLQAEHFHLDRSSVNGVIDQFGDGQRRAPILAVAERLDSLPRLEEFPPAGGHHARLLDHIPSQFVNASATDPNPGRFVSTTV